MKATQLSEHPRRDITPEHTVREQQEGLHEDVIAAYRYVNAVIDTADYTEPLAWHGWALREAFLAGVSHAEAK